MARQGIPERPALVWTRADLTELEFPIWPERPITIGRDETNGVALDSAFVSKTHARIEYRDGTFVLEDLRSANGTRVNGAAITTSAIFTDDDIEIGDQRLKFVDRATSPRQAAAGPGLGKNARLMFAAFGTLLLVGGPLMLIAKSGRAAPRASVVAEEPVPIPEGEPARDSGAFVPVVEARAKAAGINIDDALIDEASVQRRNERLLEAEVLLAEVVRRTPAHELAKARLTQVRGEREKAVRHALASGERALIDLRWSAAELAFERAVLLTTPEDERRKRAEQGLQTARGARRR